MKRQKMITLCPTTYEIAQAMPNFSQWVREQLMGSIESKKVDARDCYHYDCPECDTRYTLNRRDRFFYCMNDECHHQKRIEGTFIMGGNR